MTPTAFKSHSYRIPMGHSHSFKGAKGFQSKHGSVGSKLYWVWKAMNQRCYNPKNKDFKHYGGRGITVCDRWKYDFSAFMEDVSPRLEGGKLDRKDNDGPYSPDNCRWASQSQQMLNTRRGRLFEVGGKSLKLREWAAFYCIDVRILRSRISYGWDLVDALTRPVVRRKNQAAA